jgi:hypothetical protein
VRQSHYLTPCQSRMQPIIVSAISLWKQHNLNIGLIATNVIPYIYICRQVRHNLSSTK